MSLPRSEEPGVAGCFQGSFSDRNYDEKAVLDFSHYEIGEPN